MHIDTWLPRCARLFHFRLFDVILASILGVCCAAAPCQADVLRSFTFQGLGPSPSGLPFPDAVAVSDNGVVVVGQSLDRLGLWGEAIRWTAGTGWQVIENQYGDYAGDVSADGSVVVGRATFQAFRWTESGGMANPVGPPVGQVYSDGRGVSRDGRFVAGDSNNYTHYGPAFVYDAQSDQMHTLEYYQPGQPDVGNAAYDIANSGNTFWTVGSDTFEGSGSSAARPLIWKNEDLFYDFTGSGRARAVTLVDGMPVVALDHEVLRRATLVDESSQTWQYDNLISPADFSTVAFSVLDISTDGSMLVGHGLSLTDSATVWEKDGAVWGRPDGNLLDPAGELGGQLLKDVLLTGLTNQMLNDLSFANWQLTRANGVTVFEENGIITSVIVGQGINPAGQYEPWMATVTVVPEPGSLVLGLISVCGLLAPRMSRLRRSAAP